MKLMKILNLSLLALVAVVAVNCGGSDDQQQQQVVGAQQQFPNGYYPNGQYPGAVGNCASLPGTTQQPDNSCRIACPAPLSFNAYAGTCDGWSQGGPVTMTYFTCYNAPYPNGYFLNQCFYTAGMPQGQYYGGVQGTWYINQHRTF